MYVRMYVCVYAFGDLSVSIVFMYVLIRKQYVCMCACVRTSFGHLCCVNMCYVYVFLRMRMKTFTLIYLCFACLLHACVYACMRICMHAWKRYTYTQITCTALLIRMRVCIYIHTHSYAHIKKMCAYVCMYEQYFMPTHNATVSVSGHAYITHTYIHIHICITTYIYIDI